MMCIVCLLVAPSPPVNVNASTINSTAVQISWDSPSTTNGIIRYYTVVYGLEDSSETQELNSTDVTIAVANLDPFHSYVFYVLAFTVELSNHSENDTAITAEAGNTYEAILYIIPVHYYLFFSSYCSIKCSSI